MYFTKMTAYAAIVLLCIGCNYISDLTSGGGQGEGADFAKDEGIVLAVDAADTQGTTDQDEIGNLETSGNVQNEVYAGSLSNLVTKINQLPKVVIVIDDWGQQCPLQNSEYCGGHGGALVPAHDENITGFACGHGAYPNEMVVNYEWVDC